tara:strand:- start:46 stop:435 length:390 start_codon:yes stop_codon:yes gene_type:complete
MKSEKKSKNLKKRSKPESDDITDSRFSELKTNPQYLEMPQKQKKIKIDQKRFGKLFDKNSEFNTIGKFDKTGKRVDAKDKMMQKYYRMDQEGSGSEKDGEGSADQEEAVKQQPSKGGKGSKFYDEEGNF